MDDETWNAVSTAGVQALSAIAAVLILVDALVERGSISRPDAQAIRDTLRWWENK
jgi:hypothetical protein